MKGRNKKSHYETLGVEPTASAADGQDEQRPMDERVGSLVMAAFADALTQDAPGILVYARQYVDEIKSRLVQNKRALTVGKKELKKRREKIKTKAAVNVFHLIIDQQLARADQEIANAENDLEMCQRALEQLNGYESAEEITPPKIRFDYSSSFDRGFYRP